MLSSVDIDELRCTLGGVVLEAAYLERTLRTAFSALVGSKYAAVVDGRLMAAALIEDCEQITRYHTGITEPAKDTLLAALRACRLANKERNRVIHDTWAMRADRGTPARRPGRGRRRRAASRDDHRPGHRLGACRGAAPAGARPRRQDRSGRLAERAVLRALRSYGDAHAPWCASAPWCARPQARPASRTLRR